VWVADLDGPSDLVSGLGMLGLTNHRHIDITFQLQDAELAPVVVPPVQPPVQPETAPVPVPEQPPVEAPETVPDDVRWQVLLDKLDQIIELLEARVG
jgi:hypothetical protein